MREYAILVKDYCLFVSIDDKHKIKVGDPGCPVASAERGRRVLVRSDENFLVGDHDFTKFGIIPSVIFIINVPEQITDSWYHGEYMDKYIFIHVMCFCRVGYCFLFVLA